MGQIVEAEYRVVPERTLDSIAAEIRILEQQTCQALIQGAVEIGCRLREAKSQIEHGNWEDWCRQQLGYSPDWVANLMRIAEKYGPEESAYRRALSNPDTCRDLSISKALRLLKVPEEQVEQFVKETPVGELTVKELEAEIRQLKEKTETLGGDLAAKESDYIAMQESMQAKIDALQETIAAQEQEALIETGEEERQALQQQLNETEQEAQRLKEDLEKLKEKRKLEKQKQQEAIQAAEAKATEEGRKAAEAEWKAAAEEAKRQAEADRNRAEQAEEKARAAAEQLQSAGAAAKAEAKALAALNIKGELMQEAFQGILQAIEAIADEEKQRRLHDGVSQILQSMQAQL